MSETINKRDDALRYLHHIVMFDNLPTEAKKLKLKETSVSLTSH